VPQKSSVLIVGGGMLGLSAATHLSKRTDLHISLSESETDLGGLCGSWEFEGKTIEKFYHQWYPNDPNVQTFLQELGLIDHLQTLAVKNTRFYNKSPMKVRGVKEVKQLETLSLWEKMRMVLAIGRLLAVRNWRNIDRYSVEEFIVPWCGQSVYQKIWRPMLLNKFGQHGDQTSAVWLWHKFRYGAVVKATKRDSNKMSYYEGGFARLIKNVRKTLQERNVEIHLNTDVQMIKHDPVTQKFHVELGGKIKEFDAVLTTVSPEIVNEICDPSALVTPLKEVPYSANICLILRLRHSLTDAYWTSVVDSDFPFVGIIEHSNLVFDETDDRIVYLSRYIDRDDPDYTLDDNAYLAYCLPFVQRMFPDFKPDWIRAHSIWRTDYGQPINVKNYTQLIPPTRIAGSKLFVRNMAQIYPEFRGTGIAMRDGRLAAEEIMAAFDA